ncbi:nuclear transport factor 2 family protein [Rhodococcus qingshengii]|uniref:nuclear transport factor 2 family protein n=1 Tax=Rhodococcus qingshengii TaxID=334542 RepID=UPI001BE63197|nr:nuclear transport factor 2 family protein [Rhodococcus qingshengii]MBT2274653.1 nuclear transport factor 2 family protein [Rhodococcus qingshengii]
MTPEPVTPTETFLSGAEQILAIEEIKRIFAARLRCMDNKDWHIYPTLHTDDVESLTFGDFRVIGPGALTEAIKGVLDGPYPVTSVHHGHTPEIEFTSATTAHGIWATEDKMWWTNGDREEHLHGYGYYHEEYRTVSGRWLTSIRIYVTAAFSLLLRLTPGW